MAWKNVLRYADRWNRKLHTYVGLYLLLFIWLFAVTGLLLNHPQWKIAQFWANRTQSSWQEDIVLPVQGSPLVKARAIMRQLGITGEIEHIERSQPDDRFSVRVVKPGKIIDVRADPGAGRATVEQIQVNAWGAMHMLHSFTGVRINEPEKRRDWTMTKLWSLSIDGVSIGVIAMVISGLYMWYRRPGARWLGSVFLVLGSVICSVFALGMIP